MIHYRPADYPQPHIPSQHQFLSDKWDHQHRIPPDAEDQHYDSARKVLMYRVGEIQEEIHVKTPPVWVLKERNYRD